MWFSIIGLILTVAGGAYQAYQDSQFRDKKTGLGGQPVLSQSQIAALNQANMQAVVTDSTIQDQLIEQENSAVQSVSQSQNIFIWIGLGLLFYGAYKLIKK